MRNRLAKAIRRMVYGDLSQRDTKYMTVEGNSVAVGKRGEYKFVKKQIKIEMREGVQNEVDMEV